MEYCQETLSKNINVLQNSHYLKKNVECAKDYTFDIAQVSNRFLSSFPNYQPTPLVSLEHLAKELGVSKIYIKDESKRFNLNAFKVCGASFAMGKYIASRIDKDINEINYEEMVSQKVKNTLGQVTFVTATDGNHGRAVA